jgi:hypothetical protein
VLKFIGGGAAYFKVQTEMPSEEEVQSMFEVGQFLHESYGDYIFVCIMCTPDIEIRDIEVVYNDFFSTDFVSIRKMESFSILNKLREKLKSKGEFTVDDHILRIFLPFMGGSDDEGFEHEYCKFLDLYKESGIESPDVRSLVQAKTGFCRWFSDDCKFDFSILKNRNPIFPF